MPRSLDELRRSHPHLGFALYAIEPGGAVTLEIIDGSDLYSFRAATEHDAIELAFPAGKETQLQEQSPIVSPTGLFD